MSASPARGWHAVAQTRACVRQPCSGFWPVDVLAWTEDYGP